MKRQGMQMGKIEEQESKFWKGIVQDKKKDPVNLEVNRDK